MKEELKLIASEVIHRANYIQEGPVIKDLYKDGISFVPSFCNSQELAEVLKSYDECFQNEEFVTKESNGFDKRIYAADERAGFLFKKLEEFSTPLFKKYSFVFTPYHFLLLGWMTSGEGNLGSGSGWHRDSPFAHQFKTLMYLTDVNSENGPFEYIKGSHTYKRCKSVSEFLGKRLSDKRFSEEEINSLIQKSVVLPITECIAEAGSLVVVDTRGLHRGKPMMSGQRKAITRYHDIKKFSHKFY
ncbi:phytanoyl-CoA dioxygenase family protein [Cyclobacteriaceae bacterium]|nr:phytanoyl-CoA dioxygenase family protein [Cyclobacteriaceae bacterium]